MNLWGLQVDRTLGWILLVLLCIVLFVAYMYVIRFIRRYATGMVAGFLLLFFALWLSIGPAYYLLSHTGIPTPNIVLACLGIILGGISFVVGAFEIRSFNDF